MEVATARVYNWDVAQRRKDKASGAQPLLDHEKSDPAN